MEAKKDPFRTDIETKSKPYYLSVKLKYGLSHTFSFLWVIVSIYLSINWVRDLATIVTLPGSILIICGIAYIPGYMGAFLVASLLLDRQPRFKIESPAVPVTVLVAAYNEQECIYNTLQYIAEQDYDSDIHVIVINNNSNDNTDLEVLRAKEDFNLNLTLIHEKKPGKFHALNTGLHHVDTQLFITLDADTIIHPSAIQFLVARIQSSPANVCAVAGSILAKNSRESIWTRIQEWDYFLAIASIKRLQGLYQSTLVAQGAFSLYRTECVKEVGGWPDAIGEDIVLTWRMLKNNSKVYFEPLAVAFTDTPSTLRHLAIQRSRWARGMIEGLIEVKPWNQPLGFAKYLTTTNLMMVYLDFIFTFCWLPGLILAFFGIFWIVGPMTLFVLPFTLLSYFILYLFQKKYVFGQLGLRVRDNKLGFILFVLVYQLILSPVSTWGYLQEFFQLKRVWE